MNKSSKFYKGVIILGIISFFCFLSGYVLNVVLAKLVSKDLYGDFSITLQTFFLVTSIMLLGTDISAKKFLSTYISKNEAHTAADYIKWNFNLVLKSSAVILIILAILAVSMSFLHLSEMKHYSTYHLATYVLFFAPIGAIPPLINSYLIANRNVFLSSLMNGAAAYILILFIIYLGLGVLNYQVSESFFIFSIAASFIVLAIFEIFVFSKKLPKVFEKLLSNEKSKYAQSKWQETSNRLVVHRIAFKIIGCLSIYLLEIFGHREIEVGELAAVLAICTIIPSTFDSINTMIVPLIGSHFKTDRLKMQLSLTKITYANFLVSVLIFVVIMFFGKPILRSFGADFYSRESYIILGIVGATYVLGSIARSSRSMLAYTGNEEYLVKSTVWELGILLVLGIILTRIYGIYGVTIAMLLSSLIKMVVVVYLVRAKTGYKPLGFI